MNKFGFVTLTGASLLLAACGGDDAAAPPTNQPPVFTNTQLAFNYAENGTAAVATLNINDEAANTVVLTISGTDANDFTIRNSRDLAFVVPPNFDAPTDANADNVYRVTVTARDVLGNNSSVDITVTVTDIAGATRFIDPLFARTASLGSIAVPSGSGSVPVSFIGPDGDTMAARPLIVVGASRTAGMAQFAEGLAQRGYVVALADSSSASDLFATARFLQAGSHESLRIDSGLIGVTAPGDGQFATELAAAFQGSEFAVHAFAMPQGGQAAAQPLATHFYATLIHRDQ